MAGGLSYKFQGSEIAIATAFVNDSPPLGISGITRANPPVVTSTAHGLTDGDLVMITGVVGMTELNNGVYVVLNTTANTFELADVDATGYGTYAAGADEIAVATFSNFCELTNYNRTGGTSPEISTTTICSTAQEFVLGLPDFGTTQIDFNFAPATAVQVAIDTFYRSGAVTAVKITLPDGGGVRVQKGFIQQTSETAGVGGLWTGSLTIRNTGPSVDIE